MGFKEEMNKMREQEAVKAAKSPKGGKTAQPERILAGAKDYDYNNLGAPKPLKGGNPWS